MKELPETIHVGDIDHFIQLLFSWHKKRVSSLEHMLSVPEGTEVTFNDEGSKVLEGDLHKGFIIGLSLGLMELGTLPFAVELDKDDAPASLNEPVQH